MDFTGTGQKDEGDYPDQIREVRARLDETAREMTEMRERVESMRISIAEIRRSSLMQAGRAPETGMVEFDRALAELIKSGRSETGRAMGL